MATDNSPIIQKMQQLSEWISRWDQQYYMLAQPTVTDAVYDQALAQLIELETQYPHYKSVNSPTLKVGSDKLNTLEQYEHSVPILSLDKVNQYIPLQNWIGKKQEGQESFLLAQEKIDGVCLVLYYKNGQLSQALTRGDGYWGNDVSENIRTIKDIPLWSEYKKDFIVRGEVFLNQKDFFQVNAMYDNVYSNARNLVAGVVRRINAQQLKGIPLQFIAYQGIFQEDLDDLQALALLKKLFFRTPQFLSVFTDQTLSPEQWQKWMADNQCDFFAPWMHYQGSYQEIQSYIESIQNKREALDYQIDGLVFKWNSYEFQKKIGSTEHHPRWAIAYKFSSPEGFSEVLSIDIQVGRTGQVTPVAKIKPVLIAGSTITSVSLYNQSYIQALGLNIHDQVLVCKRGDVIPAIQEVILKKTKDFYVIDQHCPYCGHILQPKGPHFFCEYFHCSEREKRVLEYFCGKQGLDIPGFGEKLIDLLYQHQVHQIPHLYHFDYDQLLHEAGFGSKKVQFLKSNLEQSKKASFSQVLTAIGLEGMGKHTNQLLIESGWNSWDNIQSKMRQNNILEQLKTIKGIGEKLAYLWIEQFQGSYYPQLLDNLKAVGFSLSEPKKANDDTHLSTQGSLGGQVWCITGEFAQPRKEIQKILQGQGARVTESVNKSTTHLLVGQKAGSKLQKAQKYGLTIVYDFPWPASIKDQ